MRLNISLVPLVFLLTANAAIPQGVRLPVVRNRIAPIADVLAKGEGNWDSVNRGVAGDTPGGIQAVTGKSFSQMTVGQVRQLQRQTVFAVGRYQFIPSTLAFAVEKAGVRAADRFTPEVQDRLLLALVVYKRPVVGDYLSGKHDNIEAALDALALEWASVAWRDGRSYYAGWARNAAHITRHEAALALRAARGLYSGSPTEVSNDRPAS